MAEQTAISWADATCHKQAFPHASAMDTHRYQAHPDYGRLRFEWDAKAMRLIGGGL